MVCRADRSEGWRLRIRDGAHWEFRFVCSLSHDRAEIVKVTLASLEAGYGDLDGRSDEGCSKCMPEARQSKRFVRL